MKKYSNKDFPLPSSLDPTVVLPDNPTRPEVLSWGTVLLQKLQRWMSATGSPFTHVVCDLGGYIRCHASSRPGRSLPESKVAAILQMLSQLYAIDALPAIIINHDRNYCENKCRGILRELEKLDRKTSRTTIKSKHLHPHQHVRTSQSNWHGRTNAKLMNYGVGFRPEPPSDSSSFAGRDEVPFEEVCAQCDILRQSGVEGWMTDALIRGVAVHHAGVHHRYQTLVEILFARGYIRVLFATGVANMDCKTLIFSGDSDFLSPSNFRQFSGRAGRKGLDALGTIVFHEIPAAKVRSLFYSKPPTWDGHFPITNTLILRLCTLLHEPNCVEFALNALDSFLSHPRRQQAGTDLQQKVTHHLRFAIEYLQRARLINHAGAPINFAGCVAHLYFIEESSLPFHRLLTGGYFHRLCANIDQQPDRVLQTLMLVLARIFARDGSRPAEKRSAEPAPTAPPLPALPEEAAAVLRVHNDQSLRIFVSCLQNFIEGHLKNMDNVLPLTKISFGADNSPCRQQDQQAAPVVRSAFVALSGHGDHFETVSELSESVRSGVCFEESAIPHYGVESQTPLNACKQT